MWVGLPAIDGDDVISLPPDYGGYVHWIEYLHHIAGGW